MPAHHDDCLLPTMIKKQWPAAILMLTAISSIQVGAVLAKQLFDTIGYFGALGLSHTLAALVLLVWQRPNLKQYSWADQRLTMTMGFVLMGVYLCFYGAIGHIPLGVAITFQFVGPLGLAVIKSHHRLDLLWIGFAATGIVLLSPIGQSELQPVGVGLGLCAGLLMAVYITLAPKVGRRFQGQQGVALAMASSALLLSPITISNSSALFQNPQLLLIGLGVATFAAMVPFCLDTIILQRTAAQTFGLWLSLEPAIATLVGWLFLGERLPTQAMIGILLISIAAAGHSKHLQQQRAKGKRATAPSQPSPTRRAQRPPAAPPKPADSPTLEAPDSVSVAESSQASPAAQPQVLPPAPVSLVPAEAPPTEPPQPVVAASPAETPVSDALPDVTPHLFPVAPVLVPNTLKVGLFFYSLEVQRLFSALHIAMARQAILNINQLQWAISSFDVTRHDGAAIRSAQTFFAALAPQASDAQTLEVRYLIFGVLDAIARNQCQTHNYSWAQDLYGCCGSLLLDVNRIPLADKYRLLTGRPHQVGGIVRGLRSQAHRHQWVSICHLALDNVLASNDAPQDVLTYHQLMLAAAEQPSPTDQTQEEAILETVA